MEVRIIFILKEKLFHMCVCVCAWLIKTFHRYAKKTLVLRFLVVISVKKALTSYFIS